MTRLLLLALAACGGAPQNYPAEPRVECPGCSHGAFVVGSQLKIESSWQGRCHTQSPGPFPTPGGDYHTTCEQVAFETRMRCPKAPCTVAGDTVTATGPGELVIEVDLESTYGKRKRRTVGPYQIRNPTAAKTMCQSTAIGHAELHVDLFDGAQPLELPNVRPSVHVKGTVKGLDDCQLVNATARTLHYQCTKGLGLDSYELALEIQMSPTVTLSATARCSPNG